jgi:hypothetical protein
MTAFVSLFSACGGGGSIADSSGSTPSAGGGNASSSSGTQASFSPTQITATGANESFQQFTVDATVSNPPAGSIYVMISADKPVVLPGGTSITQLTTDTYRASFTIDSTQTAGIYSGNFTLSLCGDSQCANKLPIGGATLPYSITILPDPLESVAVNGTVVAPSSNGLHPIHVGDVATITTNIAAIWPTAESDSGYQILSSTSTSITIQFTSNSASTTPQVAFLTAGGLSLVDFDFSAF